MVFPVGVKGVMGVRVSDAEPFYATELEVHNTPQQEAFQMLANLLASAGDIRYISSIAIISNTGSLMGVAGFQTTSATTPGYLFTWGLTSTTGLAGVSGTAYGIYFVTNIQSTVAGTVATIALYDNVTTAFIGVPASPVPVVPGQFIQVSVAIFAGLTNWSGTITASGVSVTTVTVNQGFLQAIPFIYLPGAILRLSYAGYNGFVTFLVLGQTDNPPSYPPGYAVYSGSAVFTWSATVTPSFNISTNIIIWEGYAGGSVVWAGSTTTYSFNATIQAVLSTTVTFPGGVSHFFTLVATFSQ